MTSGSSTRRRSLTRAKVINGAMELVDEHGWEELSMSACAERLGIASASLYNHVRNLHDLRGALQVAAMTSLGEHLSSVAMGRSGPDGLRALMDAHRHWATTYPRRYQALTAASPDPESVIAAAMRVNNAVRAMLASCGLRPDETFDAAVSLFAAMHGFSALVNTGFIDGGLDQDRIYESVVRGALAGIAATEPR
ncbi:TetR family transcriptional regulator [Dietzia sp. NCCP-2495]|nr:TetR/AcrR family transcriptional regulator [Dietzia sp. NCCP-2495]GLB65164.1 TetR family transcriptional regulator [Dietzia sp. NCCP-2495]